MTVGVRWDEGATIDSLTTLALRKLSAFISAAAHEDLSPFLVDEHQIGLPPSFQ
jgi:hypothetical protein